MSLNDSAPDFIVGWTDKGPGFVKSLWDISARDCYFFWDYKHLDGNGFIPYGITRAICMLPGRNITINH